MLARAVRGNAELRTCRVQCTEFSLVEISLIYQEAAFSVVIPMAPGPA